jgi:hypothetical protein
MATKKKQCDCIGCTTTTGLQVNTTYTGMEGWDRHEFLCADCIIQRNADFADEVAKFEKERLKLELAPTGKPYLQDVSQFRAGMIVDSKAGYHLIVEYEDGPRTTVNLFTGKFLSIPELMKNKPFAISSDWIQW